MARKHAGPSAAQLRGLGEVRPDGPIIALNLNRYRKQAEYPPGTPDAKVSGREAYARYAAAALPAIRLLGGRILWMAAARQVLIGCEHDEYDDVVGVWYPNRAALLGLEQIPGYREAYDLHRAAAMEHSMLLICDAPAEPVLPSFDSPS